MALMPLTVSMRIPLLRICLGGNLGTTSFRNPTQPNSTTMSNQRGEQPLVPKISNQLILSWEEVSTHLWVLPNHIACGELYFIWFSQIIYNSLLKRVNFAHQYHSLKNKPILKHLNPLKPKWMNLNPNKSSWVQLQSQLLLKGWGCWLTFISLGL